LTVNFLQQAHVRLYVSFDYRSLVHPDQLSPICSGEGVFTSQSLVEANTCSPDVVSASVRYLLFAEEFRRFVGHASTLKKITPSDLVVLFIIDLTGVEALKDKDTVIVYHEVVGSDISVSYAISVHSVESRDQLSGPRVNEF
jgi:hypothetical protein